MTWPLGKVTTTGTDPVELAAGTTTFMVVEPTMVKDVTAIPPKVTAVAFERFLPKIDMTLPPAKKPWKALRPRIMGEVGETYVKTLDSNGDPFGVFTAITAVPSDPAGAIASMKLGVTTVNAKAGTPPNVTEVAPLRFAPNIVCREPPAVDPVLAEIPSKRGVVDSYLKVAIPPREVPPGVVTSIVTIPAPAAAGLVAVIVFELFTVNAIAGVPPNRT